MEKNYRNFVWKDEIVDNKLVSKITVQIHKPVDTVTADNYLELVSTDGKQTKKTKRSFKTDVSDYSYVLLSTGIWPRSHGKYTLSLRLYLTDKFQPSMLENVDFLGKSYVLEALEKSKDFDLTPPPKPQPVSFREYLSKRGIASVCDLIQLYAQSEDFEKVEQLFADYNISVKYQAVFWKELYRLQIAKNQK